MKKMPSYLKIKRVKTIHENELDKINPLLDEGVTWDLQQGAKFLSSDDNAVWFAYYDGELIGFLSAHRLQRFDQRKAEVLLYEIGVSQEYRRKGVATALIDAVKSWAKEVEADQVWVLTNKSNTAGMSLYAATGGSIESDDEQMFSFKV